MSVKVASIFVIPMQSLLSCLHPNPGWNGSGSQDERRIPSSAPIDMVGKHCILELYECDQIKLNDEAFLRTVITSAAKRAGATLLNLITHRFEPQGITGLALLAESHISIHTWPENGYAAVDVFTCGDHTMPEKACEIMRIEFCAKQYLLKNFERQSPRSMVNTIRAPMAIDNAL